MPKYRNKKTELDGILFDSRKEAMRYMELKLLQRGNEIENLELQPKFDIVVNGMKVCTYRADFQYHDLRTGEPIVEDVKGFKTPIYRLKAKLMKAALGVEILET